MTHARQCAAYAILARARGSFEDAMQWDEIASGGHVRRHGAHEHGESEYFLYSPVVSSVQALAAVDMAAGLGVFA